MKLLTRQEEMILLAIYQSGGESSLVSIHEYLNHATGKEWSISSIYVPLDRLDKSGHLNTKVGEPEARRGGRAVKYYTLTHKGLQSLQEIKTIHDTLWTGINDLAPER